MSFLPPAKEMPIDMIRSGLISCLVSTTFPRHVSKKVLKGTMISCHPPFLQETHVS